MFNQIIYKCLMFIYKGNTKKEIQVILKYNPFYKGNTKKEIQEYSKLFK